MVKATGACFETSESGFILACLRAYYNSGGRAGLTCPVSDAAFRQRVLSMARGHGIVPLVYEGLNASGLPASAASTLRVLQDEFRESASNGFLYAAELVRVSKYLEEHGVSALAFKGPTLALLLYGKLSLRTVRDLDLLVARRQIDQAMRALQACGYEPVSGTGGEPPSISGKTRKHVLFVHCKLGFAVELHWAVADASFVFPLRFEQAWAERQAVTVMGHPIATLSREHMLLLMAAHGTNHCWGSMKWICDIAQAVIAFHDIDWNRLLARAHRLGCRRMLLVGLALAREICGVQLPQELEPHSRTEKVDNIRREIQMRIFAEREPAVYLERILTFVRSRERLIDRVRVLWRFVGPELNPKPGDFALIQLPRCFRILYFPMRLARILLFRWNRTVRPIAQSALDLTPAGGLSANPSK